MATHFLGPPGPFKEYNWVLVARARRARKWPVPRSANAVYQTPNAAYQTPNAVYQTPNAAYQALQRRGAFFSSRLKPWDGNNE